MKNKIDKSILEIINKIKNNGFEAYIVGGYIRDIYLNKQSYDVDITTSAPATILKEIFKDYIINENFIGMGSIKFEFDKYHFEITTFRKEYDYVNNRRPSRIEFVETIEEDLIRRDFTINAICSDGKEELDLFNGLDDLNNKVIKVIGDPIFRLKEDALRVLRALRFASKLSFVIDEKLNESIKTNYKYLKNIAFETKYRELKGILNGENYLSVLKNYCFVLKEIFSLDDLKIDLFTNKMTYEEKEALFFYYSNNKVNNKYLINKALNLKKDKMDLKKKLSVYGKENIYDILYFRSNIFKEQIEVFALFNEIINNNECYNLKSLDINGNDLLNVGLENNKISNALSMLLNAVIENKCENNKKELLKYLKENILD